MLYILPVKEYADGRQGGAFQIHPEQASKMQKDKCKKGKRFLHTDMPTPQ